jgi:hypothetical protein
MAAEAALPTARGRELGGAVDPVLIRTNQSYFETWCRCRLMALWPYSLVIGVSAQTSRPGSGCVGGALVRGGHREASHVANSLELSSDIDAF